MGGREEKLRGTSSDVVVDVGLGLQLLDEDWCEWWSVILLLCPGEHSSRHLCSLEKAALNVTLNLEWLAWLLVNRCGNTKTPCLC
eukprot:SAG31_NODE_2710_length_5214_cov_1.789628_6_plen_85_part_00